MQYKMKTNKGFAISNFMRVKFYES